MARRKTSEEDVDAALKGAVGDRLDPSTPLTEDQRKRVESNVEEARDFLKLLNTAIFKMQADDQSAGEAVDAIKSRISHEGKTTDETDQLTERLGKCLQVYEAFVKSKGERGAQIEVLQQAARAATGKIEALEEFSDKLLTRREKDKERQRKHRAAKKAGGGGALKKTLIEATNHTYFFRLACNIFSMLSTEETPKSARHMATAGLGFLGLLKTDFDVEATAKMTTAENTLTLISLLAKKPTENVMVDIVETLDTESMSSWTSDEFMVSRLKPFLQQDWQKHYAYEEAEEEEVEEEGAEAMDDGDDDDDDDDGDDGGDDDDGNKGGAGIGVYRGADKTPHLAPEVLQTLKGYKAAGRTAKKPTRQEREKKALENPHVLGKIAPINAPTAPVVGGKPQMAENPLYRQAEREGETKADAPTGLDVAALDAKAARLRVIATQKALQVAKLRKASKSAKDRHAKRSATQNAKKAAKEAKNAKREATIAEKDAKAARGGSSRQHKLTGEKVRQAEAVLPTQPKRVRVNSGGAAALAPAAAPPLTQAGTQAPPSVAKFNRAIIRGLGHRQDDFKRIVKTGDMRKERIEATTHMGNAAKQNVLERRRAAARAKNPPFLPPLTPLTLPQRPAVQEKEDI